MTTQLTRQMRAEWKRLYVTMFNAGRIISGVMRAPRDRLIAPVPTKTGGLAPAKSECYCALGVLQKHLESLGHPRPAKDSLEDYARFIWRGEDDPGEAARYFWMAHDRTVASYCRTRYISRENCLATVLKLIEDLPVCD